LVFHPFFDDGLVADNFDTRLIHVEWHAGKAFRVQLVELVLVVVMIGRAENHAAQAALGNEGVNTLGRFGRRALGGVEGGEMILENVGHGLLFAEPGGVIQGSGEQRLFGRAIGVFANAQLNGVAFRLVQDELGNLE